MEPVVTNPARVFPVGSEGEGGLRPCTAAVGNFGTLRIRHDGRLVKDTAPTHLNSDICIA